VQPALARTPSIETTEIENTTDNGRGLCLMSLDSSPSRAQVWLDGHDTGRRTPLIAYRISCTDHTLVIRRADLELAHTDAFTASAVKPVRRSYVLH
jgi:hypothetical protein